MNTSNMKHQFDNLVNGQVDPTAEYYVDPIMKTKGFTQLMMYAATGNHTAIKHHFETLKSVKESQLINHIINQQNDLGWTPLMIACRNSSTYSNIETVKILLENGADVNIQNCWKSTSLSIACTHLNNDSNMETVRLLLEYKANPNLVDDLGRTPLMFVCRCSSDNHDIQTIQLLLENGANVDTQDYYDSTTLMYAAYGSKNDSNLEIIQLLLKYGANVNIMNMYKRTAFTKAYDFSSIEQHNKQILKLLLKSKTDIKLVLDDTITVEVIISLLL